MAIATTGILFIYLCILLLLLVIPVMIGIYVYQDASRRRMNAVLWTLVAVITPVFVGLIIYLLVRGHYSDLECPVCKGDVEEDYTVCPSCGARLRRICPGCGYPLEEGWKVCPSCAVSLEGAPSNVTPPVHRKDKALWKLLLAVVLIPVILFMILLFSLSVSTSGGGNSSSQNVSYTPEDMERYREIREVWTWLEECRENGSDGIYVLRYQEQLLEGKQNAYLIYRPSAGNMKKIETSRSDGWFRNTLIVSFEDTDDSAWDHAYYPMTYISYCGDEFLDLEILVDGEEADYELTGIYIDPVLE